MENASVDGVDLASYFPPIDCTPSGPDVKISPQDEATSGAREIAHQGTEKTLKPQPEAAAVAESFAHWAAEYMRRQEARCTPSGPGNMTAVQATWCALCQEQARDAALREVLEIVEHLKEQDSRQHLFSNDPEAKTYYILDYDYFKAKLEAMLKEPTP